MQSTRFMTAVLRARASPIAQQAVRSFRSTATRRSPMPKEEHAAHTISQRIRSLKRIPPELIPLGVVLAAAVGAAGYSLIRKLYTDKTLRLSRTGKQH